MQNCFGIDPSGIDVPAFLVAMRLGFVVAAVATALLLARRGGARTVLALALLGNTWAWTATHWPLQRPYAVGPSHDRVGNLALCQVVAAGNSPLRTPQVGQIHFEPLWGLVVAALSGFDPVRVLQIYPFLPLAVLALFVGALYAGLRPPPGEAGFTPWERALIAGAATLLSSSPLDHLGVYRVPWSLAFLLKPNHALGLVLFPLVLIGLGVVILVEGGAFGL